MDHLEFTQGGDNTVARRMETRQVEPGVRDGLSASAHLAAFGDMGTPFDSDYRVDVVSAMTDAARRALDGVTFNLFMAELESNPMMTVTPGHQRQREIAWTGSA